jgi:hypothetical protein
MASAKILLGGAGAATALGVRVARSLYGRWRRLPGPDRERIAPLAEDAKERALELRGATDRDGAERQLRSANESLAAALIESAETDPDVGEIEVRRLRDELRRELERFERAEIRASRGTRGGAGR